MKKLLAYGLSFLMALTCLTGCGGGSEADLRVAVGKDTADLDPAIVDDSVTANILAQVYQGLYTLDTDGNVITNLATDMPEISEDGLTYTIKISGDTKWRSDSMNGIVASIIAFSSKIADIFKKKAKSGEKAQEIEVKKIDNFSKAMMWIHRWYHGRNNKRNGS